MSAPTIRGRRDFVLTVGFLVAWSVLAIAYTAFGAYFVTVGKPGWLAFCLPLLAYSVYGIIAFAHSIRAWRKERAQ